MEIRDWLISLPLLTVAQHTKSDHLIGQHPYAVAQKS